MPISPEDRDRYPVNWATVIRPSLLRRARLRCECEGECGRGHDGRRCPELHLRRPVWSSSPHRVILTIAHLDHTPETADPALLKAMCPGCHIHYDRRHHAQSEVTRWQRALEQAGQDALFNAGTVEALASGGNGACLPDPPADWPEYVDVDDEWTVDRPDPRAGSIDAMAVLSVLAMPETTRVGLDGAIALLAEWEAWGELVRETVAAALSEARAHDVQTNELAVYTGLTKPRMYRLLKPAETTEEAHG